MGEWTDSHGDADEYLERALRAEAEVEQLQDELGKAVSQSFAHRADAELAQREVERLQGLLRVQTDLNVDLQIQAEEQQREVERLRKKADWGDRQIEVVQELESEIARLRLIKEAAKDVERADSVLRDRPVPDVPTPQDQRFRAEMRMQRVEAIKRLRNPLAEEKK